VQYIAHLIEQGDSEISKIEEEMEEVAIRLQKNKAEVTALKALDLPALPAIVMRAFLQRRVAAEIPLPEDGVMQEALSLEEESRPAGGNVPEFDIEI
jgi:hypothetical protein